MLSDVVPFRNVNARRPAPPIDDDLLRIINACRADFRDLVIGALFTGARYGELRAMKVGDFDQEHGTVYVPATAAKERKAKTVILTDEGSRWFSGRLAGRAKGTLMFATALGESWRPGQQAYYINLACKGAGIDPPMSFHQLRHAYATRAINAGVPLIVVAENLGHAGTHMVEKHYGHLRRDYQQQVLREQIPDFGIEVDDTVISLAKGRD
jgi:integrase